MNRLHEAIRRLPPGVEFLVVVTWAFGLPIFASIMSLAAPNSLRSPVFTNAELFAAILFEVIQLGFLAWFLRIRGWTLEKFGLAFSWRDTAIGLALLAVTYALVAGVQYVAQVVFQYDMQGAGSIPVKIVDGCGETTAKSVTYFRTDNRTVVPPAALRTQSKSVNCQQSSASSR